MGGNEAISAQSRSFDGVTSEMINHCDCSRGTTCRKLLEHLRSNNERNVQLEGFRFGLRLTRLKIRVHESRLLRNIENRAAERRLFEKN